jgi:hypothetical protein
LPGSGLDVTVLGHGTLKDSKIS